MNTQDILIELDEIIWRYCNRTNRNYHEIWDGIQTIADMRGLISKPMEAVGLALIARDILNIWEGN